MSSVLKELVRAEELVERCGDPMQFKNDYVLFRERHGVAASITLALSKQHLFDIFTTEGLEA